MPDNEPTSTKNDQVTDRKSQNDRKNRRGLIIGVSIAGLLLIGIFIGGGLWVYGAIVRQTALRTRPYIDDSLSSHMMIRPAFGYGNEVDTQINNGTVTTTVYTYQTGVVVAVNSDNIVIAGGGKQTTILTNSSTTYTNDKKPAVNDTVRVTGTTADSKTTATNVTVLN
jgi:hypothetical protein